MKNRTSTTDMETRSILRNQRRQRQRAQQQEDNQDLVATMLVAAAGRQPPYRTRGSDPEMPYNDMYIGAMNAQSTQAESSQAAGSGAAKNWLPGATLSFLHHLLEYRDEHGPVYMNKNCNMREMYRVLAAAMNKDDSLADRGRYTSEIISNKFNNEKRKSREVATALEMTGASWDEETGILHLSEEQWTRLVIRHPKAKWLKAPCRFLKLYTEAFGRVHPDSNTAMSVRDLDPQQARQRRADPAPQSAVEGGSNTPMGAGEIGGLGAAPDALHVDLGSIAGDGDESDVSDLPSVTALARREQRRQSRQRAADLLDPDINQDLPQEPTPRPAAGRGYARPSPAYVNLVSSSQPESVSSPAWSPGRGGGSASSIMSASREFSESVRYAARPEVAQQTAVEGALELVQTPAFSAIFNDDDTAALLDILAEKPSKATSLMAAKSKALQMTYLRRLLMGMRGENGGL